MFTKVGELLISHNFNKGIKLEVRGPRDLYYAECREYEKNCDTPKILEGHQLNQRHVPGQQRFESLMVDIEFYIDFELVVYKLDYSEGMIPIYFHRFNDRDRWVKFNLDTDDYNEALIWERAVLKYTQIHGCIPLIVSKFEEINHKHKNFFLPHHPEPYKTYNIGRYPKSSNDYKSKDPRKKGLLWFGHWKTIWSYQHPRLWKNLSSQEIVDDILGL